MTRDPKQSGIKVPANVAASDATPTYAIGYGKPPVQHQFKPGESGNRRGRPRRGQSIDGVYATMFQSIIPMLVDGKRRRLTMLEAMALRSKKDLLTGSPRTIERWLAYARQTEPATIAPGKHEIDYDGLTDEQLRVIASITLTNGPR